jgi:peptide/nickel transport system permease protein
MLLVSILVFLSVRFVPGDIIDMMISQMSSSGSMSAVNRPALEKALGLDQPLHVQYGRWLGVMPQADGAFRGLLQGDFGKSLWRQQDIGQMLLQRLPVSLELALIAVVTSVLIAIPLGAYSAVRQDTVTDNVGRSVSIIFLSVPAFWIAR